MIDSIKAYVKDNFAGLGMMVLALVLGGAIFSAGGCSWGDIITKPIPAGVRNVVPAPPRATLNEGEIILQSYLEAVQVQHRRSVATGQLLADSLASGWELAGFFNAATNFGITSAEGALSGLPGGQCRFRTSFVCGWTNAQRPRNIQGKEQVFQ